MGTHSFFRCTKQMERHKPLVERNVAVLEDRPYGDGELLAARATLPNTLADLRLGTLFWLRLEPVASANFATLGAVDLTLWPTLFFEECTGAIFVVIGLGYVVKVHRLSSNEPIISETYGFVKYIIPKR